MIHKISEMGLNILVYLAYINYSRFILVFQYLVNEIC